MKRILERVLDTDVLEKCTMEGFSPLISRVIAGRVTAETVNGQNIMDVIQPSLKMMAHPSKLKDMATATNAIVDAIRSKKSIGILTDYDVDGITAHAIIYKSLTEFLYCSPERVYSIMGNRFEHGYGVNDALVDKILAATIRPDLIITADCGSSDEPRIKRLVDAGIEVVVTDHHLVPPEGGPVSAVACVNPSQPGCDYPDKNIAGCCVAFLVMASVKGHINPKAPMSDLLDYVALGTVADAVSLFSTTNRAIVNKGLQQMNTMRRPCWQAFNEMVKQGKPVNVGDLGFQLGPRINARSRMADPYTALYYLLGQDLEESMKHLKVLNSDNEDRKAVEKEMLVIARDGAKQCSDNLATICYDDSFHPGVQGIVASRIMEYTGKPAIMLAPNPKDPNLMAGSCRTVPGIHIRDALQFVADNHDGILVSFGGHAMAAGAKINKDRFEDFKVAMDKAIAEQVGETPDLKPSIISDGGLTLPEISIESYWDLQILNPFGREFEAPIFSQEFVASDIRMVGRKGAVHMQVKLSMGNKWAKGIWFNAIKNEDDKLPISEGDKVLVLFELDKNEWNDNIYLQFIIRDLKCCK